MKKSLLIITSLLTLGVVTGIYAQTTTGTSIVDKMKAVAHNFTLGSILNPTDTGLTSDPVKGKKTGDILTAGEWNRMLELASEGGGGSGNGEMVMSEMSSTAYANLIDAVNYCRNLTENGITNWKFPTYGDLVNFIDVKYSQDMVWVADFDTSVINSTNITKDYFASIRLSDGYWSVSTPADGANKVRCVAQTGGATSSGGGIGTGWVDVPLTDTASFDIGCQYRFRVSGLAGNSVIPGFSQTHWYEGTYKSADAIASAGWYYFRSNNKEVLYGIDSSNNGVWNATQLLGAKVTKVEKLCGGGGAASSGGLALYKCTNAQSLDATNAPCYGASRNGGAGTNQYRVVSCTDNDGTRSYTMSSILNFGQLVANKWAVSVNGGTIECDDGTVLVMDVQGGGSGASPGWENVSQTDNTPFDKTCEYRFYMNAMGLDAVYYINVVAPTMLVYISHSSVVSSIPSNNKTSYQVNGSPVYTVSKIEKRCN